MRAKIKAGGHASPYRLRKQLPEPVFGQIKQARGFRQFLLRGFEKVRAEWAIVCTAHNLLKLVQRRSLSAALLAPEDRSDRDGTVTWNRLAKRPFTILGNRVKRTDNE
jgi:hypothetical protein